MLRSELQRIRVLHLGSPTGLYGAERWILALARYLPPARVESWVAVIDDSPLHDAPLCQNAARLGLHTHKFESRGRLSLSAIGQLHHFIRENNIDVLHTHGYKTDVVGCLAALGTRCKTVTTPHGWNAKAGIRLKLYEGVDRLSFLLMDAVAPLSRDLYTGLGRLPFTSHRLHLIPNGVDLADVDSAGRPPERLESWRADGEIIIGYVGRLDGNKRVDTLIRAFHRLEIPRRRLCIVGEGPLRAELEHLAAELDESARVEFFGYREDRMALVRAFDLFVLPSENEGIPRCLMEAMGAGVAAVASDIPGCRNLVDDRITGLLFPTGDDAGLARCMMTLAENPRLRAELGAAGREHVRSAYSAEAMAQGYLALYEHVMDFRGGTVVRDAT